MLPIALSMLLTPSAPRSLRALDADANSCRSDLLSRGLVDTLPHRRGAEQLCLIGLDGRAGRNPCEQRLGKCHRRIGHFRQPRRPSSQNLRRDIHDARDVTILALLLSLAPLLLAPSSFFRTAHLTSYDFEFVGHEHSARFAPRSRRHLDEIRDRIDAACLGRLDQAVHHRCDFSAAH